MVLIDADLSMIDEVQNAQQNLVLTSVHIGEWMWVPVLPQNLPKEMAGCI